MATLKDIEGVDEAHARKLHDAGVRSVEDLLKLGGTPSGRTDLAAKTGISEELILEWVNHADLFRIRGIGGEYSDLLEEAGVDRVVELATRNPANLYAALAAANAKSKLDRRLPPAQTVAGWIEQAKALMSRMQGVFIPKNVGETAITDTNGIDLPEVAMRELGWEPGDVITVRIMNDDTLLLNRRPRTAEEWVEMFSGKMGHVFGDHEDTVRYLDELQAEWEPEPAHGNR